MKEVVFAPDFIGAAFIDPHARAVLERWRDGQFKSVLNRQLLLLHLKTLRDLGLAPHLLKRWTFWLTSPEKSTYFSTLETNELSPTKLCERVADSAKLCEILCYIKSEAASHRWITAVEFG